MLITKMSNKIPTQTVLVPGELSCSYFDNALDGLAYCQMVNDELGYPVDFIFIQVNKSFEKLIRPKVAVTGGRVSDLIPGIMATNPEIFEICGRVAMTGKPESFDTYINALGKWFSVSIYSTQKMYFVASIHDITKRQEASKDLENAKIAARNVLEDLRIEKEKLAKTTAKDEALLESIGEGVVATDQEGLVILVNKVAEKLLGFTSAELIGKTFDHVISVLDSGGNQVSENIKPISLALNLGASGEISSATTTSDYHFVRKDAENFPVALTVTPVFLDSMAVGGVIVFRDITKEKEIDYAKSEFISIASHQLRTPVSGINWLIEALVSGSKNFPAKQKKYIMDLSTMSNRLVMLIEDLLNYSRIEFKTQVMSEVEKISIDGFIRDFIKELKPYAESKKHKIVYDKRITDPFIIEINKKSLFNVLQNLIFNAIEYSPENTAVGVGLSKNDGFVKISISNNGPAIIERDKPHIFERFYRSAMAKKIKPSGTGLGLYIVKSIVEGIGGEVGFESEGGKATVFWFTIPIKEKNGLSKKAQGKKLIINKKIL